MRRGELHGDEEFDTRHRVGVERHSDPRLTGTLLAPGAAPTARALRPEQVLQLQRLVGNQAIQRVTTSRDIRADGRVVVQRGPDQQPKEPETWGEWVGRNRWKIAGGAVMSAVAIGGLYLYYRNNGGASVDAPGVQPEPSALVDMAEKGIAEAPPAAVVAAVDLAIVEGPTLLERAGGQIAYETSNAIVDALAGNSISSITRGTVYALQHGLSAAEALDLAVPPDHFGL